MTDDYELRSGQDGWFIVHGDESIGPLDSEAEALRYLRLLDEVSGARVEIAYAHEEEGSAEPS